MNTGEKIKYFRLARNMTQEQLAQEAEISFSTLSKYEANERNPKYEQLLKIAAALEISVNIFMDFDIESVSDLLSILFKMENQADLEITTTKESAPSLSDDLSKIKTEGLTTIWFATGNSSAKTKDFRSNPKAGICFYKEGNSVAMTGEVEVVSDTGTKKELWQDWFIHHFPKGPEDPEYILLKFRGNHATIWIDGQFVHRKV